MRSFSLRVLSLLSLAGGCAPGSLHNAADIAPRADGRFAPMPLSRADAFFDADGVTLSRRGGAAIRLRLESWGREGALVPAGSAPVQCEPFGPRCASMEQARAGLTEWWIGLDSGVEQGFTIHERPLGGQGSVGFSLATEGALLVDTDGETAWLTDADGETWTVGGLAAWDADGVALPVRFAAHGAGLWMWVDDTDARYPVTVDPVYSTYAAQISPMSSLAGLVIAGVGDVNGDGIDDIAVGDPYDGDGVVYIYTGSASGAPRYMQTLSGLCGSEGFGMAIAGGDVDGDGYSDVVIGAPGCNSDKGRLYTFLGDRRTISLSTASTGQITGSTDEELGASVAVGDLNNDGRADIIVGAPGYSSGMGRVRMVQAGRAITTLIDWPVSISRTPPRLGESVAIAPDLNGDGYADVAAGAPDYNAGVVFVSLDAYVNAESSSLSTLLGATSGDDFGISIIGIGDADGDGYGELLVGAPDGMLGAGVVYLYAGSSSGVGSTSSSGLIGSGVTDLGRAMAPLGDIDADGFTDFAVSSWSSSTYYGRVDIYSPGGSRSFSGMSLTTLAVNTYGFGVAIAGSGDLDADGYDDLLVSACFLNGCSGTYVYQGYVDGDGDGFSAVDDCDDGDAAVYPGATERLDNGLDDDCDGLELCYVDHDRDGYPAADTTGSADTDCDDAGEHGDDGAPLDCDDGAADVNPAGVEGPGDLIDGDCDGFEQCYVDQDMDAFRAEEIVESSDLACAAQGLASAEMPAGDCDDLDPDIYPGAVEAVGDQVDSDCDGGELCYTDGDGDGRRPDDSSVTASDDTDCVDHGEATAEAPTDDCDDNHSGVYPGAEETPGDGVDRDCDGRELCFTDGDGDGVYGETTVLSEDADCLDAGELGDELPGGDCDDAAFEVHPGAEELPDDGVDQDCDGEDSTAASEQKGCSTTGNASKLGLLALLGLALARRR